MDSSNGTKNQTTEISLDKHRIKLGDLNNDCLIQIFKDFNVDDLINVVEYDNRVGDAARYIYTKNFAANVLTVSNVTRSLNLLKYFGDVVSDDCLNVIVYSYDVDDFVQLVGYCDRVLNAAQNVFKVKFGEKLMEVSNEFNPFKEEMSRSMKLLKYFGGHITKLRVKYVGEYHQVDYKLEAAILSYCRKSLVELELMGANVYTMHELTESFEMIRKVTLKRCKSRCLISNFAKWFPNAHTLYLVDEFRPDSETQTLFHKHYPTLKYFKIKNTEDMVSPDTQTPRKLCNWDIFNLITLNPQLKSLWIIFDKYELVHCFNGIKWEYELLAAIQSKLPELESLRIKLNMNGNHFKLPKINLDSLRFLKIELSQSSDLDDFPIMAKNIETLTVTGKQIDKDQFLKFMNNFENVTNLDLSKMYIRGYNDFKNTLYQCANTLKRLNELHIPYESIFGKCYEIYEMLNRFKGLKKATVSTNDSSLNEAIFSLYNNAKWGKKFECFWKNGYCYCFIFENQLTLHHDNECLIKRMKF